MKHFDNGIFIRGNDCPELVGEIDKSKIHVDSNRISEDLAEAIEKAWSKLSDEEKQECRNRIFSYEPFLTGGD